MDISKRLKIITDSNKTVFRAKDLQALWGGSISANKIAITRMVKKGLITRIANGYYSLNENFNIYEFANLIISSSYISLNSALFYHGIASQVSNEVSSIASFNHEKKAQDLIYKYYVIKESILLNLEGIQHKTISLLPRQKEQFWIVCILEYCRMSLIMTKE